MRADATVKRRMDELAERALTTGRVYTTAFLSPAERTQAEISARQAGVGAFAHGGYPDAERCVVAFAEDPPAMEDYPFTRLLVRWDKRFGAVEHRDLLGAILGLGIERSQLGDLVLGDSSASIFCLKPMVPVLCGLSQAGRTVVSVEQPLEDTLMPPTQAGQEVRGTVASLRLDAMLGLGLRLSRGKASALVEAGRVQVDHQLELKPDRSLVPGQTISVRGMGRLVFVALGARTKKDRLSVTLRR